MVGEGRKGILVCRFRVRGFVEDEGWGFGFLIVFFCFFVGFWSLKCFRYEGFFGISLGLLGNRGLFL